MQMQMQKQAVQGEDSLELEGDSREERIPSWKSLMRVSALTRGTCILTLLNPIRMWLVCCTTHYVCMHLCIYVDMHLCIHAFMYTFMHIRIHACIHAL